jgi:F0F1-type ATP synthase membrane subunit c/vacuolar-type H+-ATPase subunit K
VNYPPTPLRVDQRVFSTDYINKDSRIEYRLAIKIIAITTMASLATSILKDVIISIATMAMANQPKLIKSVFNILSVSYFFMLASVLFGQ